jgi:hypothetical protein
LHKTQAVSHLWLAACVMAAGVNRRLSTALIMAEVDHDTVIRRPESG